jgi:hypothetical protein
MYMAISGIRRLQQGKCLTGFSYGSTQYKCQPDRLMVGLGVGLVSPYLMPPVASFIVCRSEAEYRGVNLEPDAFTYFLDEFQGQDESIKAST